MTVLDEFLRSLEYYSIYPSDPKEVLTQLYHAWLHFGSPNTFIEFMEVILTLLPSLFHQDKKRKRRDKSIKE